MLRIFLLGKFEVERDGELISEEQWPGRKAKNLLKVLALRPGHRLHKEQAIELLWPEKKEAATSSNLYRVLYTLRKILEPGLANPALSRYIYLKEGILSLAGDGIWIDLEAFEAGLAQARQSEEPLGMLEQALRWYRGDLLEEDLYEEWAVGAREILSRDYQQAALQAAVIYGERGNYRAALELLNTVSGRDPLDEAIYRELMHNYARGGQRQKALQVYRRCEQVLQAELNISPDPLTTTLYRQILAEQYRPEAAGARPEAKAGARPAHNLPAAVTSFIGREAELGLLEGLLRRGDTRLVTLTGPGGVGKTRLGLQLAHSVPSSFEDGIYFVPLAAINQPEEFYPAIAQALKLSESGGQMGPEGLKAYLGDKRMLLLLDNFEQVIRAAPLIGDLLEAAPDLKIVVTSRTILRIYGEFEFAVAPLRLPDIRPLSQQLEAFPALRLFEERTRAVRPGFEINETNFLTVARICARLDGLPLAIELAAARMKLFSPEVLLDKLSHRLEVLRGGASNLPDRQRTLRNAIEWSYNLLEEGEKRLFASLAVFRGSFSAEAAGEVINPGGDSLSEQLLGLVDKSLVQFQPGGEGSDGGSGGDSLRFFMLETLQEYGWERLSAFQEREALQERHSEYYLQLAERLEVELNAGANQAVILNVIDQEQANFGESLNRALETNQAETALRLAGALWSYWRIRGYYSAGRNYLERGLKLAGPVEPRVRAKALNGAGAIFVLQNEGVVARRYLEESLQIWRELGDEKALSGTLNNLGVLTYLQSDYPASHRYLEESLAFKRRLGEQKSILSTVNNLGQALIEQGQYEKARVYCEEGLQMARGLEHKVAEGTALNNLGRIAINLDQPEKGQEYLAGSLGLFKEVGYKHGIVSALLNMGNVAYWQGRLEEARQRFEESLPLSREMGDKAGQAICLNGLGLIALAEQNYRQALENVQTSLGLCREAGIKTIGLESLIVLAKLLAGDGQNGADLDLSERLVYQLERLVAAAGYRPESIYRQALDGLRRRVKGNGRVTPVGPEEIEWEAVVNFWLEVVSARQESSQRQTVGEATISNSGLRKTIGYPNNLTRREVEILRLVAGGLSDRQIAEKLVVSRYTVNAHLKSIYAKLAVKTRSAATRSAFEKNLV